MSGGGGERLGGVGGTSNAGSCSAIRAGLPPTAAPQNKGSRSFAERQRSRAGKAAFLSRTWPTVPGASSGRDGSGDARQRRCLSRDGSGNARQRRCLSRDGSGTTRQRRCLSRDGSGNARQSQCLTWASWPRSMQRALHRPRSLRRDASRGSGIPRQPPRRSPPRPPGGPARGGPGRGGCGRPGSSWTDRGRAAAAAGSSLRWVVVVQWRRRHRTGGQHPGGQHPSVCG